MFKYALTADQTDVQIKSIRIKHHFNAFCDLILLRNLFKLLSSLSLPALPLLHFWLAFSLPQKTGGR